MHRLRAYRKEAGLSGTELADRAGVSVSQISRMERGLTGSMRAFARVADALSVALERRITSAELMGNALVPEAERPTHELRADDTIERIGGDATYDTMMLIHCAHDLEGLAIRAGDLLVSRPGAVVKAGLVVVVDEGDGTRLRLVEQLGSGFVLVSPSRHDGRRPGAVLFDPARHAIVGVIRQLSRSY